jgi:hypothetical protein
MEALHYFLPAAPDNESAERGARNAETPGPGKDETRFFTTGLPRGERAGREDPFFGLLNVDRTVRRAVVDPLAFPIGVVRYVTNRGPKDPAAPKETESAASPNDPRPSVKAGRAAALAAGFFIGSYAGYSLVQKLLAFDRKLAALPRSPFDLLPVGTIRRIHHRTYLIEQTPSGALLQYNIPDDMRAILFIAPGKMASMEPAHGWIAQNLSTPGGRRGALRGLWHLDEGYYYAPGGLIHAIEAAYLHIGTVLLSSVDENNPRMQLRLSRAQQTARTREAWQAIAKRFPGVPIQPLGSSLGG